MLSCANSVTSSKTGVDDGRWCGLRWWCCGCCWYRRVPVLLGAVLHAEHHQCHVHPLRSVPVDERLPVWPDLVLVLRLARLHQQFPQPCHLHHLQRRVSTSLQASSQLLTQVDEDAKTKKKKEEEEKEKKKKTTTTTQMHDSNTWLIYSWKELTGLQPSSQTELNVFYKTTEMISIDLRCFADFWCK